MALSRRSLLRRSGGLVGLGACAAGLAMLGGCQLIRAPTMMPAGVRRVGYLDVSTAQTDRPLTDPFLDQLRQLGWVEGENLSIEWRFAEGRADLLPELAADLVRLPVDVIVAQTTSPVLAARQRTSTIPIVMLIVLDPLSAGLVSNLAHPGGNITGVTYGSTTISIKAVELLKTVLPQLARLAILGDRGWPSYPVLFEPAAKTAERLGMQVTYLDVRTVEDVDGAFEQARAWGAEGLYVLPIPTFIKAVNDRVGELTLQNRLPAIWGGSVPFSADELMGFGPNIPAVARRGGALVDKILRGANPGELPVQEPREFDFVVFVTIAQALGITFSPDAAAQVTQWVQ